MSLNNAESRYAPGHMFTPFTVKLFDTKQGQAELVHSNINLSAKGIGLFFTTNRYHLRHHSIVLEESNTNYGCATIFWDRVFGSYVDGDTIECGVEGKLCVSE